MAIALSAFSVHSGLVGLSMWNWLCHRPLLVSPFPWRMYEVIFQRLIATLYRHTNEPCNCTVTITFRQRPHGIGDSETIIGRDSRPLRFTVIASFVLLSMHHLFPPWACRLWFYIFLAGSSLGYGCLGEVHRMLARGLPAAF